jgi:hypothetical protein
VDFAILAHEERCIGDCEWLAGERGLLEMLIEMNIEILGKYRFKEILITDPHAYRTLLNIYPRLRGTSRVKHYAQFLAERLGQLKPLLNKKPSAAVTYHDSRCLGRFRRQRPRKRRWLPRVGAVADGPFACASGKREVTKTRSGQGRCGWTRCGRVARCQGLRGAGAVGCLKRRAAPGLRRE